MSALDVTPRMLTSFVRTVRDYAQAYQITGKRETFKLAVIGVTLGAHFPHDPRLRQMIDASLGQTTIPQSRRVELFCSGVSTSLGAHWKDEGLDAKGARLIAYLSRTPALEDLFPNMTGRKRAFLDACMSHADGYSLRAPRRRQAYFGAALIHGIYWFDNPVMYTLRRIIETSETDDLMLNQISEFYSGFA